MNGQSIGKGLAGLVLTIMVSSIMVLSLFAASASAIFWLGSNLSTQALLVFVLSSAVSLAIAFFVLPFIDQGFTNAKAEIVELS